jgi:hypothetical protein
MSQFIAKQFDLYTQRTPKEIAQAKLAIITARGKRDFGDAFAKRRKAALKGLAR